MRNCLERKGPRSAAEASSEPCGRSYLPVWPSWVDTLLNVFFSWPPMEFTTVMMATEMPAAIRPYSMAVAPDSPFIKRCTRVFMAYSWIPRGCLSSVPPLPFPGRSEPLPRLSPAPCPQVNHTRKALDSAHLTGRARRSLRPWLTGAFDRRANPVGFRHFRYIARLAGATAANPSVTLEFIHQFSVNSSSTVRPLVSRSSDPRNCSESSDDGLFRLLPAAADPAACPRGRARCDRGGGGAGARRRAHHRDARPSDDHQAAGARRHHRDRQPADCRRHGAAGRPSGRDRQRLWNHRSEERR